jgi:hypothetical protein
MRNILMEIQQMNNEIAENKSADIVE